MVTETAKQETGLLRHASIAQKNAASMSSWPFFSQMLVLQVFLATRVLYGAFGPPHRPPSRPVFGECTALMATKKPRSFFVAWSPLAVHYFFQRDGIIEDCVWDVKHDAELLEKAAVLRGLVRWHRNIDPNAGLDFASSPDAAAWTLAQFMLECE